MPQIGTTTTMPLFPLGTVLFPGGKLPLRIFEARYVDMIGQCMREQSSFGVVLIRQGNEARQTPEDGQPDIFEVGTTTQIIDFNQADNGLLGIVCQGQTKFSVRRTWTQPDHLMMAEVELHSAEAPGQLTAQDDTLLDVLRELSEHPLIKKLQLEINFEEALSVSYRLADLLPIEPEIKQTLLQLRSARERLTEITRLMAKFQG